MTVTVMSTVPIILKEEELVDDMKKLFPPNAISNL